MVTKPDFISDPREAEWGNFIAGNSRSFAAVPALGVHPVRARTAKEYGRGISTREVVALGDEMFDEEEWRQFAHRCGRSFGWKDTSHRLSTTYHKMVKDK